MRRLLRWVLFMCCIIPLFWILGLFRVRKVVIPYPSEIIHAPFSPTIKGRILSSLIIFLHDNRVYRKRILEACKEDELKYVRAFFEDEDLPGIPPSQPRAHLLFLLLLSNLFKSISLAKRADDPDVQAAEAALHEYTYEECPLFAFSTVMSIIINRDVEGFNSLLALLFNNRIISYETKTSLFSLYKSAFVILGEDTETLYSDTIWIVCNKNNSNFKDGVTIEEIVLSEYPQYHTSKPHYSLNSCGAPFYVYIYFKEFNTKRRSINLLPDDATFFGAFYSLKSVLYHEPPQSVGTPERYHVIMRIWSPCGTPGEWTRYDLDNEKEKCTHYGKAPDGRNSLLLCYIRVRGPTISQ